MSVVSVVAAVVLRAGDGEGLQVQRRFGCFAAVPPMFCIEEERDANMNERTLFLCGLQQSQW